MRLHQFLAAAALFSASAALHADTSTYNFTYNSTAGDVPGETATGNGTFTVSYTPGFRTGTLTAFYFTDTIDSSLGDSTFTYSGLHNVASSNIVLTLGGQTIARGDITTDALEGTNVGFGAVNFELQIIPTEPILGSTSYSGNGNPPDHLAGNTSGAGTVTFVSATSVTPEPSSFLLLGTGLLGIAGVCRKRLA